MKRLFVFLCVIGTFLSFTVYAKADEYEELNKIVPKEVKDVLEDTDLYNIKIEGAVDFSVSELICALIPDMRKTVKEAVSSLSKIMCVLILSSLIKILKRNDAGSKTYETALSAVCAVLVLTPATQSVLGVIAVIRTLTNFMLGYIPIYSGVIIASGTPAAAAGYSTALLTVSELFSQFADKIAVPFTGVVLGMAALAGISSNELFSQLSSTAKKVLQWLFATTTSLFVLLLSVQTTISAAKDSLLLKSGKMFAGMVPVVGSSLSDSLSVTFGSMSIIKSGIGLFGIVITVILLVPPLLKLLILTGGIRVASAVADTLGTPGIKRVLSGIGDTADILLAVYSSLGSVFVISTAVMLKVAA